MILKKTGKWYENKCDIPVLYFQQYVPVCSLNQKWGKSQIKDEAKQK